LTVVSDRLRAGSLLISVFPCVDIWQTYGHACAWDGQIKYVVRRIRYLRGPVRDGWL
jgi:hypothetical protein